MVLVTKIIEDFLSGWRYCKIKRLDNFQKNVLEIGCGSKGHFLKSLAYKNPSFTYIGIDPKVKIAKNPETLTNLRLIPEKIISSIPLSDQSVDAVIILAVLEHLDKPREVLTEIYRVLKLGGVLYLTTPTPKAKGILETLAFKLKIINPHQILEHQNYFSVSDLEHLLSKIGFIDFKYQSFQAGYNSLISARKK
jgi:ubiquinone/menaquinone biosynthesis C-methylase UbiE